MVQRVTTFFDLGGPQNVSDPAAQEAFQAQGLRLQQAELMDRRRQQQAAMSMEHERLRQAFAATQAEQAFRQQQLTEEQRQFDLTQALGREQFGAERGFREREIAQALQIERGRQAGETGRLRERITGERGLALELQELQARESYLRRAHEEAQARGDRRAQVEIARERNALTREIARMEAVSQEARHRETMQFRREVATAEERRAQQAFEEDKRQFEAEMGYREGRDAREADATRMALEAQQRDEAQRAIAVLSSNVGMAVDQLTQLGPDETSPDGRTRESIYMQALTELRASAPLMRDRESFQVVQALGENLERAWGAPLGGFAPEAGFFQPGVTLEEWWDPESEFVEALRGVERERRAEDLRRRTQALPGWGQAPPYRGGGRP